MPAEVLYYLSDADLGDIIAHLKNVPPVDKEIGGYNVTPLARVLMATGAFGDIIAA